MENERLTRAWSVFSEHPDVFRSVLSSTGPWRLVNGADLLHDFVVERLPNALVSYDPKRGPIEPWLHAVFRRYIATARARLKRPKLVSFVPAWFEEQAAKPQDETTFSTEVVQLAASAFDQLAETPRSLIRAYFGSDSDAGNVRALSRRFQLSRYGVDQQLRLALGAISFCLDGKGILSREELHACRDLLVGDVPLDEIARGIGVTTVEVHRMLQNSVRMILQLISHVIVIKELEDRMMPSTGKADFMVLLDSVQSHDGGRIGELRDRWRHIVEYVEEHPDEADNMAVSRGLNPEELETLMLWLSTPEEHQPIQWAEMRDKSFIVDRRREQLAFAAQLWSSWQSKSIRDQVSLVLSSSSWRREWMRQLDCWLAAIDSLLLRNDFFLATVDGVPQRLVDSIIGCSLFLDQQLLSQSGYPHDASLGVCVTNGRLFLRCPDDREISCAELGQAVSFQSDIPQENALLLAEGITLSLPAHQDVLPNICIDLGLERCMLKATADTPLLSLARDRADSAISY